MSIMFTGGYSPMFYAPSTSAVNSSGTANSSGAMNPSGTANSSGAMNSTGTTGPTQRKYSKEEIQELKDKLIDAEECLDTAQRVISERQKELKSIRDSIKTVKNNAAKGIISSNKASELMIELCAKEEEAQESLLGWQSTLPNYRNAYERAKAEYDNAIKNSR